MSSARPTTHRPSYTSGYATSPAESAYPELWRGLQGAWMPCLGPTGTAILRDVSTHRRHGGPTDVTWSTAGGHCLEFNSAPGDNVNLGRVTSILRQNNLTCVLYYEKTDATLRSAGAFGSDASGVSAAAIRAFLPFSDGIAYWDFGGSSGVRRITASGLTFGNDVWIFGAGPHGLSMYQNGVLCASNTTAASLGSDPAATFALGSASEFGSDLARVRAFLVYDRQLTDEEKMILSHDPVAPFRTVQPNVFVDDGRNDVEHIITFTETVSEILLAADVHHIEHELGLTDAVIGDNASVHEGGDDLNLTDSVSVLGPIYVSANTSFGLEHSAQGSLGVPWLPIEIEHDLGLTQTFSRAQTHSVTDTLLLTDEAFRRQTVETSLGLVQTANAGFGEDVPEHALDLGQTVTVQGSFLRDASHSNILQQSLTYFIDDPCARKSYNRFQGEGDGAGIDEKPLLFDSDFVLESLSGPKTIVRLRSPEMDDRDRLGFNRISRETRGGELNVYSDPAWPKINTLLVTFIALSDDKIDELQDFMFATLGQQIKLQDWKGRSWIGVITTPGDVATEDEPATCGAWTMSFEFEGEPYDGQAIDDRIDFEQDALAIGPVEEDADPGALSLDHAATADIVTILFEHSFGGLAGSDLHGVTPDVSLDASSFFGHSVFNADGSVSGVANGSGMYLPFTPVDGYRYELEFHVRNINTTAETFTYPGFFFGEGLSSLAGDTGTDACGLADPTTVKFSMELRADASTNIVRRGSASSGLGGGGALTVNWTDATLRDENENVDVLIILDTTLGAGNWQAAGYARLSGATDWTLVTDGNLDLQDETIGAVGMSVGNNSTYNVEYMKLLRVPA